MNHDANHFRKEDGWDENSIIPGLSKNGLRFVAIFFFLAALFMWLSPINWDKVVDTGFYAWRAPWTFLANK